MVSLRSDDPQLRFVEWKMAAKSIRKQVTCCAPVNIAVIKYWGKRDSDLILPLNSSLSVTLNREEMCSTTTAMISQEFTTDRLWLNGEEQDISHNGRLQNCLHEVRHLYLKQHKQKLLQGGEGQEQTDLSKCFVHICSQNNFPTAAGLASSAAGYACLVATLGKLYGLSGDLSTVARRGSGSACRSMYGGFVKWEKGVREDGSDSAAIQVAPREHWPELEVLILVVSDRKKPTSSTTGMQNSVNTSELLKYRADVIVPRRMKVMVEAISRKDFQTFARLTMQDSNQFHAICLDTYPPISYLTDTSHRIVRLLTAYNEIHGSVKAAYTFDAGPNAVVYALSHDIPQILDLVVHYFKPHDDSKSYIRGLSSSYAPRSVPKNILDGVQQEPQSGLLQYIIHTKVGEGPVTMDTSLLDEKGFPL